MNTIILPIMVRVRKSKPPPSRSDDLPPRSEWTVTMTLIEHLINARVFRSADVMEFADIRKEAYQNWFIRGQFKGIGMKDPAPGGPGNARLFSFVELLAITLARQVGQRVLGYTLDIAFQAGSLMAWYSVGRWMRQAHDYDAAEVSAGPEPLAVLKSLIVELKKQKPKFLIFSADKNDRLIATPVGYDAILVDIWWALQEPYFTVLEMRAPLLAHFFPIALRLFERTGKQDDPELRELEQLFTK